MRNLANLSAYEFELLVADLLSAEMSTTFEVFERGHDGGIDVRAEMGGQLVVGQCKHYLGSTFADLLRAAKSEVTKLEKLSPPPDSYRFVTSRPLTVNQKKKLRAALGDWVSQNKHIVGAADLDLMLNRHERVERQHVKLWLSSGTALAALLRTGTYNRSRDLASRIEDALPLYVQNRSFFRAQELLNQSGVCLIAGEPGIGKTTLAQMLLLDLANQGLEPIAVTEDIEEAWGALGDYEAAAFYYDDFLGRNFVAEKSGKNEDDRLVQLIRLASKPKSAIRLILTTREYILKGATELSEKFKHADLDATKFLLSLDDYSRLDRAHIFYNHIWHSGQLTANATRGLLNDKGYLQIVDHRNFSPRIIEYITGMAGRKLTGDQKNDYVRFAVSALDHPGRIWAHAFEHELDDVQQALLIVLASLPPTTAIADLKKAFDSYCDETGIALKRNAFGTALRTTEGTFIRTSASDDGTSYASFNNPSIADFLADLLAQSSEDVGRILRSGVFFEQLERLWNLGRRTEGTGVANPAMKAALIASASDFSASLESLADAAMADTPARRWLPWVQRSRERRIRFGVTAMTLDEQTWQGLEPWVVSQVSDLQVDWMDWVGDKRDAVYLVQTLREVGMEGLAQEASETLKTWFVATAEDTRDFEVLNSLRRASPSTFSPEEWGDASDKCDSFVNSVLLSGDLEYGEIDKLEEMASYYAVVLDMDDLEEAREASIETATDSVEVGHDRQALEGEQEDEASESQEIDVLFAHLADDGP